VEKKKERLRSVLEKGNSPAASGENSLKGNEWEKWKNLEPQIEEKGS